MYNLLNSHVNPEQVAQSFSLSDPFTRPCIIEHHVFTFDGYLVQA